MNKFFNKVRKNRALALLLAFAMMIAILPLNTVNAETGALEVVATASALVDEDGNGFVTEGEGGKVVYDTTATSNVGKLRARVEFPADYVITEGDVITINYETNIPSLKTGMGYDYNGNENITLTSDSTSVTYTVTADDVTYCAQGSTYPVAMRFKQSGCAEGSYLTISSITASRAAAAEDTPSGGESGSVTEGVVPTVTINTVPSFYTNVSADYPNDVMAMRYTTTTKWNVVETSISGVDFTQYTGLEVTVTPSREGMEFAIADKNWNTLCNEAMASGQKTFTISYDTDSTTNYDLSALYFYFDTASLDYVSETELTAVVNSIKFVGEKAPAEPEAPAVTEVAAAAKWESSDPVDEQYGLKTEAGGRFRGMIEFPADFTGVEVGSVLTINYESTISFSKAEFAYNNSGNVNGAATTLKVDIPSDKTSLEVPITQEFADFFNNASAATDLQTVRIRLKSNDAPAGGYFKLVSVTYGAPVVDEGGSDEEPSAPSWTSLGGPTVTIDMASTGYTCVANDDGSVTVTYTPGSWDTLNFSVTEFDPAVCSQLVLDITPASASMNMGLLDAAGTYYLNHWGPNSFETDERHTITLPVQAATDGFVFYCDPDVGATLPEGPQTFTVHGLKIVDPTMPEGEVVAATLKDQECNGFVMEGDNTLKTADGGKFRGLISLPADFRVEEGKQLTFVYETNFPIDTVQPAYGYTSFNDEMNATWLETEKTFSYVIDANWAQFINENGGQTPDLRLKVNTVPAGCYFTLKGVVYGDVVAEKYDPNQVPKGLVVTYYNDIYSRGVAWNTDDTVETNALYVIKATEGMTAENVDWTSEDVVEIVATSKDTVSADASVYRTFKAHIENLEKGATYFFRAGNEETGWSKVGSFTVAKAAEEINSVNFIHVTDSQEESKAGFQKWARVLKDAYERMPDAAFVCHTGDLVNRSESKGIHMEEWVYCFDEPMDQIMNGVMAPAAGNHEVYDFAFSDRFDIDWANYRPQDDDDIKYGGSYVVTYGDDDLVVITLNNTQEAWDYETRFEAYQLPWMIEQLEAHKDYRFKVIQMHEGVMTAGDHTNDGECQMMRDRLPAVFSKYEVDLVLTGHDHVYCRTRSYYYGENPFETVDEKNPVYFNGHTPIWLPAEERTMTVRGEERTIYVEPQGTHYVCINTCGSKTYPEEPAENLDDVIFEGDNPITPVDENGNGGSIAQPGMPMYGLITIEDDILIYDSYTYDHGTRTSKLYDTFAVDKSSKAGYDDPHAGKTEVKLYGLEVPSKKADGVPVELDLSGFNCSEPSVMDYTQFKYSITVREGGYDSVGRKYTFNPGNLIYGHLPKEPGKYTLKIELPQTNRYFWGEVEIPFEITK